MTERFLSQSKAAVSPRSILALAVATWFASASYGESVRIASPLNSAQSVEAISSAKKDHQTRDTLVERSAKFSRTFRARTGKQVQFEEVNYPTLRTSKAIVEYADSDETRIDGKSLQSFRFGKTEVQLPQEEKVSLQNLNITRTVVANESSKTALRTSGSGAYSYNEFTDFLASANTPQMIDHRSLQCSRIVATTVFRSSGVDINDREWWCANLAGAVYVNNIRVYSQDTVYDVDYSGGCSINNYGVWAAVVNSDVIINGRKIISRDRRAEGQGGVKIADDGWFIATLNGDVYIGHFDRFNGRSSWSRVLETSTNYSGGVDLNNQGDWAAVASGRLFINGRLIADSSGLGSGGVALNDDQKWVAVLNGDILRGDGRTGYRELMFATPSTSSGGADLNNGLNGNSPDNPDYIGVADGRIFVNGAQVQVGGNASSGGARINDQRDWVAAAGGALFLGGATTMSGNRVFNTGGSSGGVDVSVLNQRARILTVLNGDLYSCSGWAQNVAPSAEITGIRNAAAPVRNADPVLGVGAFATIYGGTFSSFTQPLEASFVPFPTEMGGVSVRFVNLVTGASAFAPLSFVAQTQINLLVPDVLSGNQGADVRVEIYRSGYKVAEATQEPARNGGRRYRVFDYAPAFFTASQTGERWAVGQVVYPARGIGDEPQVVPLVAGVNTPIGVDSQRPGRVLVMYGTGFNRAAIERRRATVRFIPLGSAEFREGIVDYAGPQQFFPGLDQLNVRFPTSLNNYRGTLQVELNIDGIVSQRAWICSVRDGLPCIIPTSNSSGSLASASSSVASTSNNVASAAAPRSKELSQPPTSTEGAESFVDAGANRLLADDLQSRAAAALPKGATATSAEGVAAVPLDFLLNLPVPGARFNLNTSSKALKE